MEEIELTHDEKIARSKKQMMWFGIVSLIMMFAGLTSAYVVSRGRKDWVEIELPEEFFWSTGVILLSSLTLFLAKKAILNSNKKEPPYLQLLLLYWEAPLFLCNLQALIV
ncbi:alternative cytochrome c oxidase polypeptide CoxO [Nonlabens ulvanivorans]|uniref:Alternative cytochrome c oxidase polypeptide CoxO n=1 Tax=Nonlabens ulvanivorans TaxID=906888 RepID=A0A081D6I8_NONUL|nr:alternative cytochrome c oxidase polypeptide CoxO [Nonlabens ulvanivorans]